MFKYMGSGHARILFFLLHHLIFVRFHLLEKAMSCWTHLLRAVTAFIPAHGSFRPPPPPPPAFLLDKRSKAETNNAKAQPIAASKV